MGVNGDEGNNAAVNSGAAYVFVRQANTWSQQAYLKASNTDAQGRIWLLCGRHCPSPYFSRRTLRRQPSHRYQRRWQDERPCPQLQEPPISSSGDGLTWSQQAYLKASNTNSNDRFGHTVSLSADTLVVGAPLEDSNATSVNGDEANNLAPDSGAAYVFQRTSPTTWSQQAYLKVTSNSGSHDFFGLSVSHHGRWVIVGGATQEDSSATGINGDESNNLAVDAGATYVFAHDNSSWNQYAYLKATNTGAGDEFGRFVALMNDLLVVGAWQEDSNATGIDGNGSNNSASASGAAYLFDLPHLLTIYKAGAGSGWVASIPQGIACGITCTAVITHNELITLTATADVGSTFVGWSGDVVTTTNPLVVTMDRAKEITATFSLNQYELNVATMGNGTAAPNSGTYDYGTVVTLTATADIGLHLHRLEWRCGFNHQPHDGHDGQ